MLDPMLIAIGTLQNLQHLVVYMNNAHGASSTAAGASAVAHVPHIELAWLKGLDCSKNKELLQLPGIRRLTCRYRDHELLTWSQEQCNCSKCHWQRVSESRQRAQQ